jgi:hypothetical protein
MKKKNSFLAMFIAGFLGSLTTNFAGAETSTVELTPAHPPGRDEALQLQVTTGPLPRASRVRILTQSEFLGSLAPLGPLLGRRSTTSTIPIPRSALTDGKLRLRFEVVEPGSPPRPPQPGEIEHLNLILVPQSE